MKGKGLKGDAVTYTALISAFCNVNNIDKAMQLFNDMSTVECSPDAIVSCALIAGLAQAGRKMIGEGLVPNVVTYGALIHAYCLVGNLDEAMKIFTKMSSSSRVPPNTVIYNMLIDSLCKNNKVEVVVSLMDDMKGKGVRPNTNTFNAMLKGLQEINGLEKAFELMNQMTEQACNPDYVTMEILTNWLSAVGETKKLKSFVQGYEVSASTA
ncbi:hypothetical protein Vadar_017204 [Vaccinium darrowii]|uniref:Uncharacterized protein n=1 Tax=Vaccinium darrowii TaxID=229202 RepID=A0ACB7ZDB1_9ERIC|nr:hypothetical protein Vadar_017204 [Vaccinium darrowii]